MARSDRLTASVCDMWQSHERTDGIITELEVVRAGTRRR